MIADVPVHLHQPHIVQSPKALEISCASIGLAYLVFSVKQECVCNHDIYEMEEESLPILSTFMDCLIVPNELIRHVHTTHVLVVIQDRRWYWYCCSNYSPTSVFHSAFNSISTSSPVESRANTHDFCVSPQNMNKITISKPTAFTSLSSGFPKVFINSSGNSQRFVMLSHKPQYHSVSST